MRLRQSCSLMLIKLFSWTGQSGLSLWHGVTKEGALHSHLFPLLASSANTSTQWIPPQVPSAHWGSTEFTQEKAELSRTDSQVSVHAWLHCRPSPSQQPPPFKCFVILLLSKPSQRTEKLPKLWPCRGTKPNYRQLFRGGRRNTAASSSSLLAPVHSNPVASWFSLLLQQKYIDFTLLSYFNVWFSTWISSKRTWSEEGVGAHSQEEGKGHQI